MARITELELQNIRHLVLNADMDVEKYKDYVENTTDAQFKQFFQKSLDSATKNKQDLMKFLQ